MKLQTHGGNRREELANRTTERLDVGSDPRSASAVSTGLSAIGYNRGGDA